MNHASEALGRVRTEYIRSDAGGSVRRMETTERQVVYFNTPFIQVGMGNRDGEIEGYEGVDFHVLILLGMLDGEFGVAALDDDMIVAMATAVLDSEDLAHAWFPLVFAFLLCFGEGRRVWRVWRMLKD